MNRIRREGNEGFTLIEIMIAMAILTVGLLGLISMFETSMRANAMGRNLTAANRLVAKHVEELRAVDFNNVATRIQIDTDYSDKTLSPPATTYSDTTFVAGDTATIAATYKESGSTVNAAEFDLIIRKIEDYPIEGVDKIIVKGSWADRFGDHESVSVTYVESL